MQELPNEIVLNGVLYKKPDYSRNTEDDVKADAVIMKHDGGVREHWHDHYGCPYCHASWGHAAVYRNYNYCSCCGVKIDKEYIALVRKSLKKAIELGIDLHDRESGDDIIKRVEEHIGKNVQVG